MIKLVIALMVIFNVAWPVCTKISMPTDYSVVTNGSRANLKANFDETQTKVNPCMDSVDEVRARLTGYTGSFGVYSLENLLLRLDTDASTSAKLVVQNSNGDSLFRVAEDSSARVFGAFRADGAVTLSNYTSGQVPYFGTAGLLTSGTGLTYNGSAFSVTGTGAISGNTTVGGNLGLTGRLNINGATDASGYGVNSLGKNIGSTGASFVSFGLGAPGDANIEYAQFYHDGANAVFTSGKAGTGSYRPLLIQTGGSTAITVATNQAVTLASTLAVTGASTLTGAVTANGGIADVASVASSFYETGTFTITFSGFSGCAAGDYSSGNCTATASFVKVGKNVTLYIPPIYGTSNTTSMSITGVPATIRASMNAQVVSISVINDNSLSYTGQLAVGISGSITAQFRNSLTSVSSTYTSSGGKGILSGATISYMIE